MTIHGVSTKYNVAVLVCASPNPDVFFKLTRKNYVIGRWDLCKMLYICALYHYNYLNDLILENK